MVTVDAVALRAALGLPPTAPVDNTFGAPVDNSSGAPVDNTSGAPVDNTGPDLSSLFTALGLNPPQQHDNLPAGFASGGAPLWRDTRGELGDPVTDIQLVLAMLQGLNPKYENLQTILPFPTFVEAHSQLILTEINKGSKVSTTASTALLATAGGNRSSTGGMNPAHATGFRNPS
ncbi:hypothetical protein OsI_22980 [Oryza sativa Indica Group]|uniref:Uncharacterized protein n=1 Tax=Oryza sativa subsp. indica TaxID=39946 RepID=B8B2D2_ORYSI|nr:hypothetical protein OsI_22980 [Oryza sativa Indica Group]